MLDQPDIISSIRACAPGPVGSPSGNCACDMMNANDPSQSHFCGRPIDRLRSIRSVTTRGEDRISALGSNISITFHSKLMPANRTSNSAFSNSEPNRSSLGNRGSNLSPSLGTHSAQSVPFIQSISVAYRKNPGSIDRGSSDSSHSSKSSSIRSCRALPTSFAAISGEKASRIAASIFGPLITPAVSTSSAISVDVVVKGCTLPLLKYTCSSSSRIIQRSMRWTQGLGATWERKLSVSADDISFIYLRAVSIRMTCPPIRSVSRCSLHHCAISTRSSQCASR